MGGDGRSHYSRHLDSCIGSPLELGLLGWARARDYRDRAVTVILYLNEGDWPVDAAGQLRIYHDSERSPPSERINATESDCGVETYTDVVPRGGTLVVFDSRRMEHQVIPTNNDRFALTCWIAGK